MNNQEFTIINYPPVRKFTADTGRIGRDKHYIRTLLQVDVTDALQKIKTLRTPGRKISFLAWFIKVLADTVAEHPPINGIHKGRNRVLVFKNVNISTIVEKKVDGVPVPLPLVLRCVNEKTSFQINDEIQSAVDQPVKTEGNYVLGTGQSSLLLKLAVEMMGTVVVTSLGTVGRISGWIIPSSMHPLSIGIGSLNKQPAFVGGALEKRDILHLTIAIDHDVVDGMPALDFVADLVARLESGSGLD
jgi:pyruvate/2-oxoglutarate dehydrogenase complex dihydrolipoamide acyltransferase (E2) component